jgi:hypothetical protein
VGTNVRIVHRTLQKIFPHGLDDNFSYLDLGLQELYGGEAEDFIDFFRWAGGEHQLAGGLSDLCADLALRSRSDWDTITDGRPRARVADLAAPLRWRYESVDISGGSLPWDLNQVRVEPPHLGRFDVVANIGTTEHVFNQANCFKLVHDAVRVGGAMVHFLPAAGYLYHCLFKYDPKFFLLLQQANGYEMLHAGFGSQEGADRLDQRHLTWANFEHAASYGFDNFLVEFILRKNHGDAFKMPYDLVNTDLAIRHDFPEPCSSVR